MDANQLNLLLQNAGTRYMEEYSNNLQRYLSLFDDAATASSNALNQADANLLHNGAELQKRYAEFVLTESPRVWSQIAEAGFNYYTAVADVSIQALNRYVADVVQSSPSSPGAPVPPVSSSLVFHGELGDAADNAFLVSNNSNEPIDVAFEIAEMVSEDGSVRFKANATFTPEKCEIPACSERLVQCSIKLTSDFKTNQAHHSSIQVAGYPALSKQIAVHAEAPAGAAAATVSKVAPARRPTTKVKTVRKTVPRKRAATRKKTAAKK